MVEESGAKFETYDMRVENCTHLVTTAAYAKKISLPNKIKDAALKGCEIVTLDWLLDCIETGHLIDTKDYSLKTRRLVNIRSNALVKSDDDDDSESETGEDAQKSSAFWEEIVDKDYPGLARGRSVLREKDLVWDATLIKLLTGKTGMKKGHFIVSHVQLLYDSSSKKYHTFSHEKTERGVDQATCKQAGRGKLENAQDAFEDFFEDATDLSWATRHKDPKKNKYIYVDFHLKDKETGDPESAISKTTPATKIVLDAIIGPAKNQLELIKAPLEKSRSSIMVNQTVLTMYELRLGIAILEQLLKRPNLSNELYVSTSSTSVLLRYYHCLVGASPDTVRVSRGWIECETEYLLYIRTLAMASQPDRPTGWGETQLTPHLYRALGLRQMEQVKPASEEYEELAAYFNFSDIGNVYGSSGYPEYLRTVVAWIPDH
ncbi:Peptidase S10 serine carboxypeptidase [Penicillium verhagenii]|nr:Peptidase S10 serine carboxypeptidase [Penicillium verhagenii]